MCFRVGCYGYLTDQHILVPRKFQRAWGMLMALDLKRTLVSPNWFYLSFFLQFWWQRLAAGRSLNCASFWGSWGERSCPRSGTAIHSVTVDRPPNLPIERRTLYHWAIAAPIASWVIPFVSKKCKNMLILTLVLFLQFWWGCLCLFTHVYTVFHVWRDIVKDGNRCRREPSRWKFCFVWKANKNSLFETTCYMTDVFVRVLTLHVV